ncbi:MAG TPA: D-serine ammonia-lyase [Clostridiaceae bacterium]|nr:D-serine ammonia-lyase [Clostridiaceae bacterium]
MDAGNNRQELIKRLQTRQEIIWFNPQRRSLVESAPDQTSLAAMRDAAARLERFAPWIAKEFPETESSGGLIESPLVPIPHIKEKLDPKHKVGGSLFLKRDDILPVSGSVKARGGIYEILKLAETIALRHGLITLTSDYSSLSLPENREVLSRYSVAVGSTGNLGLSVGIISAKLGFETEVHMSADAREWKKERLRSLGVKVIEYREDYSKAVAAGRQAAAADPNCHFVDDEESEDLFMGYSVAALRLKDQLDALRITVDSDHPLFVYIPCGVGTGPGGITWGLYQLYGKDLYAFFAEPVDSPCCCLGLATGLHSEISVQDIGLSGSTEADGLAVARASAPVCKKVESFLAGAFTVQDQHLYRLLSTLQDTEGISLEPSALAGMPGPFVLNSDIASQAWLRDNELLEKMDKATHIVWATGGSMVPATEMREFIERGSREL